MPKMMCRYQPPGMTKACGIISNQGLCPIHRSKQSRGYGAEHEKSKQAAMKVAPYCWKCRCPATTCKLQWHHVTELRGGRNPEKDDRRQLLCKRCHDSFKERS